MEWPTTDLLLINISLQSCSNMCKHSICSSNIYEIFLGSESQFVQKTDGDEFECNLCFSKFARKDNARRHVKLVHMPEQGKAWFFDICNNSYKNQLVLDTHKRNVHKIYKTV